MTLKQYSDVASPSDDSVAVAEQEGAPRIFANPVRGVQASLLRSFKTTQPIIGTVAAFGVVGMPLYYLI
jgi:hypothetical protein